MLYSMGFPGDSVAARKLACNAGDKLNPGSEDSMEKEMVTHCKLFFLKSMNEGLVGYSPSGCKKVGHDLETKHYILHYGYIHFCF